MLNFFTLEPREFAELSKDILQKIVKKTLYLTDGPYDEGIDFTDNLQNPRIIGQAKNFIFTPADKLIRKLKKEKERVEWLRPETYYLFLPKNLTRKRLEEIVNLFNPVTRFDLEHIFTLGKMDELLQKKEYGDVLEKHPKLWNFSMDILSRALYKNIDFDTREMLLDIQSFSEFVPTESYCACIELLEQDCAVLLQGAPGTGKTVISRRIALELAQQGYQVRYTTDGNLHDIKGILSQDDTPELILLDDFLGQMYVTLDPGRAAELETLLHFVQRSKHKRILLNSRITVLQEAERSIPLFTRIFSNIQKIKVDELTDYEKARILHNILKKQCGDCPKVYRYIASEGRYWNIIHHRNFNPRIIGMTAAMITSLSDPKDLYDRLLELLNDPANIWAQEFEQNLRPEDRLLLTTLYSLANTNVDFALLETCYAARIRTMPEIDKTVNQAENALRRLNRSMLRQTWDETRKISVLNPSVNDFLSQYIRQHPLEQEAITASAVYFEQIYKVMHGNSIQNILNSPALLALIEQKFEDHSLLSLRFQDHTYLGNILAYQCIVRQPLLDDVYRNKLICLIRQGAVNNYRPFLLNGCLSYILPLFSEPLFSYYQMGRNLSVNGFVDSLMKSAQDSNELLQVLSLIWSVFSDPVQKYDYDLAFFRQKAAEYTEYKLLNEVGDFNTFSMQKYDQSEFDHLVREIPADMPIEDVIDHFEYNLSAFLEDDLTDQFVEFVIRSIQDVLEAQPWFDGKISIDRDIVLIDQNIWDKTEIIIDNAMYDHLPREAYDIYTAQRRESSDNLRLERSSLEYWNHTEREDQDLQIRSLFTE
ncbi:ATP-binding protein [Lacrimispora sp. NSJ-141]|uniref:ATP-binding protein n=1 Tax=Lientehia hominis TaxID=2897778 RepID=A0AAP2RJP1_9FIRM|nr:ATP-binding protein [Lientehia hominis]MCD2492663.1 ATP-binding protein [Lientehia hominis]